MKRILRGTSLDIDLAQILGEVCQHGQVMAIVRGLGGSHARIHVRMKQSGHLTQVRLLHDRG